MVNIHFFCHSNKYYLEPARMDCTVYNGQSSLVKLSSYLKVFTHQWSSQWAALILDPCPSAPPTPDEEILR